MPTRGTAGPANSSGEFQSFKLGPRPVPAGAGVLLSWLRTTGVGSYGDVAIPRKILSSLSWSIFGLSKSIMWITSALSLVYLCLSLGIKSVY